VGHEVSTLQHCLWWLRSFILA